MGVSPDISRQSWLDWLRALAIFMVLASHFPIAWQNAGLFLPLAAFNVRIGWSGVDLFFVISGFLIGGMLIGEEVRYGEISLRSFYLRRILKIWPLLYLTALVYIPAQVFLFGMPPGDAALRITPVFFHIQNYIQPEAMGHLWSLAVEEHFYLALPLVMVAAAWTARRFGIGLPVFLIAAIVIVVIWRQYTVFVEDMWAQRARVLTHLRIDGLMFGVLLAWLFRRRPALWSAVTGSRALLPVTLALLAWPFAFNPNNSPIVAGPGFTSLYLGYGGLLLLVWRWVQSPLPAPLKRPLGWFAAVGRHSYPIYLFHPFVGYPFTVLGFGSDTPPVLLGSSSATWLAAFVVFNAAAVGLGMAIGHYAEQPLLALRNRLVPPRIAALPAGNAPAEGGGPKVAA